jgi:hypothetical protein
MKTKSISLLDNVSYILLITSIFLLAILFTLQPKISDDWYVLWSYQNSGGITNFWIDFYRGWTGRIPLILLSSLIVPNEHLEFCYRIFIVFEVLILISLAWYLALGKKGFFFNQGTLPPFVLFGIFLWFSLPSRAETISWLNGNFAYLVPAILGLFYIAVSRYIHEVSYNENGKSLLSFISKAPIYFIIGFFAGSSQEQIAVACIVYTINDLYQFHRFKNIKYIPNNYWLLIIGFLFGAFFLLIAPGNYARLNIIELPGFYEILKRMMLYILSAFFEVGSGDLGKSMWFGILILILLFFDKKLQTEENIRQSRVWIYICFATLLTLIPATNQISPRTTFFAVIFLYIGVASFIFNGNNFPKRSQASAVLLISSLLLLVESTVGLISNISVATEFHTRWSMVGLNKSIKMTVPFIATIPSNLTYIQTPEHDRDFLRELSAHVGFEVVHDDRCYSPLPVSLKPLKAIKYNK